MKKFNLVFLILTIFLSTNAQHLIVKHATSRYWAGGRKESGFGTEYRITFSAIKTIKKISFENLWISNKCYKISAFKNGDNVINSENNTFSKDDSIQIIVNARSIQDEKGVTSTNDNGCKKMPFKISEKNKAIVEYRIGKKSYQILIKEFVVLPRLLYP